MAQGSAARAELQGKDRTSRYTELKMQRWVVDWCASWDSNPQHLDFKSNPTTDCGRSADALGRPKASV